MGAKLGTTMAMTSAAHILSETLNADLRPQENRKEKQIDSVMTFGGIRTANVHHLDGINTSCQGHQETIRD